MNPTRVGGLLIAALFLAVCAADLPAQPSELTNPVEAVGQKVTKAANTIREVFENPRVQISTVLVLVILGLTLWLLGARAGRMLFALLLGCAAIIPGMYLAQILKLPLWPGAVAGGLLGMLLGVFVFRIGIMLVGMIISTMLAVGVFAVVGMEPADRGELIDIMHQFLIAQQQNGLSPSITVSGSDASASISFGANDQTRTLFDRLLELAKKHNSGLLIATVIGLAAGLLLQVFAGSFMLVLTTSCLGTIMVLFGVWLGLIFKGKEPQELLGLKPLSFTVVFLVMIGLGLLVQLTMTRKREHLEPQEQEEE